MPMQIAKGKRVLDAGGRGIPPTLPDVKVLGDHGLFQKKGYPGQSSFAKVYCQIGQNTFEYRILDVRKEFDLPCRAQTLYLKLA